MPMRIRYTLKLLRLLPTAIRCFPEMGFRDTGRLVGCLLRLACAPPPRRRSVRPDLLRCRSRSRRGVAGHLSAKAGIGGRVEQLLDRRLVEMRGDPRVGGEQIA